jgi:hypothetical protein
MLLISGFAERGSLFLWQSNASKNVDCQVLLSAYPRAHGISGIGCAHHFGKVPGIRAETVACDGFPAQPALAFIGSGAIPAPGPRGVHVDFQELIGIFGHFLVDAAAHHHAFHAGFYGIRLSPLEDAKKNARKDSKIYGNGEV